MKKASGFGVGRHPPFIKNHPKRELSRHTTL